MAAVSGSQTAATLELATGGAPVMAIGGFDGEGGNLSLAQFKQYAAHDQIHYYITGNTGRGGRFFAGRPPIGSGGRPTGGPGAGGGSFTGAPLGGGPGGANSSSSEITSWVKAHYTSQTVSGQTVYNLLQPRES